MTGLISVKTRLMDNYVHQSGDKEEDKLSLVDEDEYSGPNIADHLKD